MKKLCSILLFMSFVYSYGQSIQVIYQDSIVNPDTILVDVQSPAEHYLDFVNNSNNEIKLMITREIIYLWPNAENYFTFYDCFTFTENRLPNAYPFPAGDTFSQKRDDYLYFYTHYNPNGEKGISLVKFNFFNNDDHSDIRSVVFSFNSFDMGKEKFQATVNANNTNMGSVTGSGDYEKDSTAIITAIPNTGYRFVQWQDGNTDNPRIIIVTQDTVFTAEFAIAISGMFHVAVNVNNANMGSVTGSGDYAANSTVTMSAIANNNYRFVQWNDGNTQNPRTISVIQDTAFMAEFATAAQGMFHVTVNSNNTSMGSVTGSGDYALNSSVTMGAIANSGYRFMQWQDGNTKNPRSITLTQDTTFTAEFAVAASGMFHVTVNANNANMGSVTGSGDYALNSSVTMGAIANSGYRFVQWQDGNTQNPRSITLTQDTTFTAEFAVAASGMFHVTVNSNNANMGSVTGSGDYALNSTVSIAAIANTGYRFVQWNDGNTNNPRSITVTQDITYTAEFAASSQNTYQVNVLSGDQAKGSVMGGGSYAANSTVSIGAIPNTGYHFAHWQDGNTENPRSFVLTQDTIFVATFEDGVGIANGEISTMNIYPNPTVDNITIVLPENVTHAVFTLYDMQGKALIRKEVNNREIVSVNNIASGIYIYHVRTEKENRQGKVVKQ
jgi:hypothetical protein